MTVASAGTAPASELSVAGDLDFGLAPDPEPMSGVGLGIRVGPRLHVPLLVVAPEIGFGYAHFANGRSSSLYRGTAGLRIGVGEILRPGVFAHLGVGHLEGVAGAQGADRTRTAFTWDVGASLDITFIPIVDVGAHVAWGSLASEHTGPFGWLVLGLHVAFIL